MNKSDWIRWIPFLDRGNGIESYRKIHKINSYLVLRDAEDEYEEKKINIISECECRCKINYIHIVRIIQQIVHVFELTTIN